ncbi:MAG: hypothetical protein QF554_11290 [Dehalococcoidia bacterium]|jgi:hypothetical protein|nr:hypothetical protein [Dehalococcoidia bacterium]
MDLEGTIQDLEGQLEIARRNYFQVSGALIAIRQLKEQEEVQAPGAISSGAAEPEEEGGEAQGV